MTDLLELRRHRFDALYSVLTDAQAPDAQQRSRHSETLLCISVILTAFVAVAGLGKA